MNKSNEVAKIQTVIQEPINDIFELIISALRNIVVSRYYTTERGFVGEFYTTLKNELKGKQLFPEKTILELEVQKRSLDHYGVTQRPDLLIHIPIETGLTKNPNENNFVNFAFKLNGKSRRVQEDYTKLDQMFQRLNYQTGVFINIGAFPNIFLQSYNGKFKNRIHEFSIRLNEGSVEINHAFFIDEDLKVETIE